VDVDEDFLNKILAIVREDVVALLAHHVAGQTRHGSDGLRVAAPEGLDAILSGRQGIGPRPPHFGTTF
jgi:hypothetical protein